MESLKSVDQIEQFKAVLQSQKMNPRSSGGYLSNINCLRWMEQCLTNYKLCYGPFVFELQLVNYVDDISFKLQHHSVHSYSCIMVSSVDSYLSDLLWKDDILLGINDMKLDAIESPLSLSEISSILSKSPCTLRFLRSLHDSNGCYIPSPAEIKLYQQSLNVSAK